RRPSALHRLFPASNSYGYIEQGQPTRISMTGADSPVDNSAAGAPGTGPALGFSVAQFASTIKPNVFDGNNYIRWRERMLLWLNAMGILNV
ncbi:unnamed protein product, partial [Urochloa humidicola]